jgi:hypothetical protein
MIHVKYILPHRQDQESTSACEDQKDDQAEE